MMEKAQQGELSVAVLGESGTGKELVARTLHEESDRADGPFVAVSCTAIPPDLAESTFFGHEKGAFTGATEQQKGHFEQADGGTQFLDEIGELDLDLQAKLLRVLETETVQWVGSSTSIPYDARVLCATNADP
ncbi:MAG: sigma-54 factor interaction domain-containing protein [Salinibacter sp.]